MSKIILIRHGESLGNMDEKHYQYPDAANILSPVGVQQCLTLSEVLPQYLAEDFHGVHTTVFASRYQRAQLTAEIVMSNPNLPKLPIHIDHRINEVYHSARGIPAEARSEVVARVRSLVEQNHFNLILFTHGMLMGMLDPVLGAKVKNAEIRVYNRDDFLSRILIDQ